MSMKIKLVTSFDGPLTEQEISIVSALLGLLKKHGYTHVEVPYAIETHIKKPNEKWSDE